MANILQVELLDRFFVADFLFVISRVVQHHRVRTAVPSCAERFEHFFIGENLTGFNRNQYIHDKFMLVDPLGDHPIVVTGTANFSGPSQYANDENMVVIRGNLRVADIYFGEFMRIFDHIYSRYIVGKMKKLVPMTPTPDFSRSRRRIGCRRISKAGARICDAAISWARE